MKILHVVPTYVPAYRYGGPIFAVHGLCRALAERHHEVHVYTTNVDGPGETTVPIGQPVALNGVRVTYFHSPALRRLYWSPAMGKALERNTGAFDVVHLHSVFVWPTYRASVEARRHQVPYLLAPRGMLVEDLFRRKSLLAKRVWLRSVGLRMLREAAAVHLTSTRETQDLQELVGPVSNTVAVPNGIDLDPLPSREATGDGEPEYALFLGRINWKKGLDRLLEALARTNDIELVIAGNDEEGYRATLEGLIARLGLGGRVRFEGYVGGEVKRSLLAGAMVLVLASYSENFGNVVLEAMAAEKPVIVTEAVGLADAVRAADAGIVVDGSIEALAAALRLVAEDEASRKRMGKCGREAVAERFAWPRVAEQMERCYREVVKAQPWT